MAKKKPDPNPIEEAIGDRAKPKTPKNPSMNNLDPEIPQKPSKIPDEPSPSEMLTLEELNRRTVERLQDDPEENLTPEEQRTLTDQRVPTIPVSKPAPQPVTETSSQESPPQKIETPLDNHKFGIEKLTEHLEKNYPADDVELTALKKYILEDGFVLSTVAFHIVSLCAEPLTTPSTTTWDFAERADIPAMVLALLNKEGYLEGIWPSLKIVMGTNVGNSAWTAGIATTIAFFDIIRMLPVLEELKGCSETESK